MLPFVCSLSCCLAAVCVATLSGGRKFEVNVDEFGGAVHVQVIHEFDGAVHGAVADCPR